jgi:hypothetical protein
MFGQWQNCWDSTASPMPLKIRQQQTKLALLPQTASALISKERLQIAYVEM